MCLADHGVEIGAKFALFEADEKTFAYLRRRTDKPFETVSPTPTPITIERSRLTWKRSASASPSPHTFDNVAPIEEVAGKRIDQALIGSCANGRLKTLK
jgi:3-isopropylmalate/(R)-2-methylmalate dehydratase large subunit